jgi:hypothetical protein
MDHDEMRTDETEEERRNRELVREYMGIASGALEDRFGWLTPVPVRKEAAASRGAAPRERVGGVSASPA